MENQIEVKVKNVYGNELIYPVCEKAKLFAELAGDKTLTQNSIRLIRELGYSVKQVINGCNVVGLV